MPFLPPPLDDAVPAATSAVPVWQSSAYTVYPDSVVQGPYIARAVSRTELTSNYQSPTDHSDVKIMVSEWKQSLDVSEFPQYTSEYPLLDALYNMALEEAKQAVEPDGTFRTGQEWAGVWTRDISYSILLAQALLQPEVAKTSLLRKVTPQGRIMQDTGTGGAYPCSTDRIIWATAAWEVYLVTGDNAWLKQIYPIVKNSIEDDEWNAYDPQTGLVRGESSFLDWREQTYPDWMQPADIYQSASLSTNAAHYKGNMVLALMATQLGVPAVAQRHRTQAGRIQAGINQHLWLPDHGYYGQYLYGRTFAQLSPRSDALGEALTVLFEVADEAHARRIVACTPVMDYGIPCIYPQIPDIPPYHNNAVWPFVQSYWGLAAAKVGNEVAFLESLVAVARPAALFLTNKENFVASNGDFAGTEINSSNMLWSVSGTLGLVYKGLFGMELTANHLTFRPFVPQALQGRRQLTNFKYRAAVLNVEMTGFGNVIRVITLDGLPLPDATLPATLTGPHTIRIELNDEAPVAASQNKVAHHESPATPIVSYASGELVWSQQVGIDAYEVLRNGQFAARTTTTSFSLPVLPGYAEYQVVAIDAAGYKSFASEPLVINAERTHLIFKVKPATSTSSKPYPEHTNQDFTEISITINTALPVQVHVPATGTYALDFRYANGNGPISTSNKCAIRTLYRVKQRLGTVIFPQRGEDEWSDWGFTNAVVVQLERGTYPLTLCLEPANHNMSGEVNQALLDYVRLTRIDQ